MCSGGSGRSGFKGWHHTHLVFQPLLGVTVPQQNWQERESMAERCGAAAEILTGSAAFCCYLCLGVLCLQPWDEARVQILSFARSCHHCVTTERFAQGRIGVPGGQAWTHLQGCCWSQPQQLPEGFTGASSRGRLDVWLSQLKHVFLLDSFSPHVFPICFPVQRTAAGMGTGWSSRHCAHQHWRRVWTALSFSFCSELIFFDLYWCLSELRNVAVAGGWSSMASKQVGVVEPGLEGVCLSALRGLSEVMQEVCARWVRLILVLDNSFLLKPSFSLSEISEIFLEKLI